MITLAFIFEQPAFAHFDILLIDADTKAPVNGEVYLNIPPLGTKHIGRTTTLNTNTFIQNAGYDHYQGNGLGKFIKIGGYGNVIFEMDLDKKEADRNRNPDHFGYLPPGEFISRNQSFGYVGTDVGIDHFNHITGYMDKIYDLFREESYGYTTKHVSGLDFAGLYAWIHPDAYPESCTEYCRNNPCVCAQATVYTSDMVLTINANGYPSLKFIFPIHKFTFRGKSEYGMGHKFYVIEVSKGSGSATIQHRINNEPLQNPSSNSGTPSYPRSSPAPPPSNPIPTPIPSPSISTKPNIKHDPINCPENMAYIPPGSFMMGRDRFGDPVMRVEITKGFCIDAFEYPNKKGQEPKVSVSWIDAKKLCAAQGKRLPTEAEWEYAAGTETATPFHWGNTMISWMANICDKNCKYHHKLNDINDGYAGVAPVGSYEANAWGVYDMVGNVKEWVLDCYSSHWETNMPTINPVNNCQGGVKRVVRGGSWYEHAQYLGIFQRNGGEPSGTGHDLGFRCVKDIR